MRQSGRLTFPAEAVTDAARFRCATAALEALRLKHNERAGDVSGEARYFREEIDRAERRILAEIRRYRDAARSRRRGTLGEDEVDTVLVGHRRAAEAAARSIDLKAVLGVDLDAVRGESPPPPDPLQSYSDATELDPGSDISQGGDVYEVEVRGLDRNVTSRLSWDHGTGGIDQFTHQFTIRPRSNGSLTRSGYFWSVSNVLANVAAWGADDDEAVSCFYNWKSSNPNTFQIKEFEADDVDDWDNGGSGVADDTTYYGTADRDSDTSIRVRIYSDASRTTLLATLTITIPSGRTWQFLLAVNSLNNATTGREADYDIDDMDVALDPVCAGAPAELTVACTMDAVTGSVDEPILGSPAGLTVACVMDAVVGTMHYTCSPAELTVACVMDTPTVSVVHVGTPADLTVACVLDAVEGFPEVHLYATLLADGTRRLSWDEAGTVSLVVDGYIYAESADGCLDVPSNFEARGILIGYVDVPDPLPTPRDQVDLTIGGDEGAIHHIYRRPDGGEWTLVASILAGEYRDPPYEGLADGTYDWKVTDEDEEGDTATSSEASATISSYPSAPSGIDYEWVAGTKTLTITVEASGSADVASYPVRDNAGDGELDLTSAPVQDTAALSYEKVFTTETGVWQFMVRAKDSDGFEEPGLGQILQFNVVDGSLESIPAEPSLVYAEPAADGKVAVGYAYRPWLEDGGGGAAYEGRIYGDNGTGTIDYATPLATVAMSNPTSEDSYEWTSGVLVADTEYGFVVRIATAASPAGVETQNTDVVYAIPNVDVPTTPTLAVEVV